MVQQYINKGCKGHYWTKLMTLKQLTATDKDIKEYYLTSSLWGDRYRK